MNQIQERLQQMGDSERDIARRLFYEHVRGHRLSPRRNPIVAALQKAEGGDSQMLCIINDELWLTDPGGARRRIALPDAVREFLRSFDRGDYPELDRRA